MHRYLEALDPKHSCGHAFDKSFTFDHMANNMKES